LFFLLRKYSCYTDDAVHLSITKKQTTTESVASHCNLTYTLSETDTFFQFYNKLFENLFLKSVNDKALGFELEWKREEEPNARYRVSTVGLQNHAWQFSCDPKAFFAMAFQSADQVLATVLQAGGKHSNISLSEVQLFEKDFFVEKRQPYYGVSNTEVSHPECLHTIFEQSVLQFPDHIAVVSDNNSWSYKQINTAANRLAADLIQNGILPGNHVGILLHRCPEVYVAMLGVLKAGAAYVPIDIGYPEDRFNCY
jgi:non-ribosomal peptide synthetase component F